MVKKKSKFCEKKLLISSFFDIINDNKVQEEVEMRIVVFDAKPYDIEFFEKWNEKYGAKITYFK